MSASPVCSLVCALLVLAVVNGCSDDRRSREAECVPARGSPVTESELKAALARSGIDLVRQRGSCYGVPPLSNVRSVSEPSEVADEQGTIFCGIEKTPLFGARVRRYVWRNDARPVSVEVLNVGCDIYPSSRRQTDVLEKALRSLPGASPAPAVIPSPDATTD